MVSTCTISNVMHASKNLLQEFASVANTADAIISVKYLMI
jgi:hypothetical protein